MTTIEPINQTELVQLVAGLLGWHDDDRIATVDDIGGAVAIERHDGTFLHITVAPEIASTTEQWCVFSEDPSIGVLVTDDLAVAEETAPFVIDAGIAVRTVTTTPWLVLPRCAGCGSVLDGAFCCEAQRPAVQS